jgi:hypothetical protein
MIIEIEDSLGYHEKNKKKKKTLLADSIYISADYAIIK